MAETFYKVRDEVAFRAIKGKKVRIVYQNGSEINVSMVDDMDTSRYMFRAGDVEPWIEPEPKKKAPRTEGSSTDFDLCPHCRNVGTFGIRTHPKFAVCYEGVTSGFPDLHMAYFHTQEQSEYFSRIPGIMVIHKQQWNPDTLKWEEYH